MTIKVKDRFLPVTGLESAYIGERNNILQVNFDLKFFNAIEQDEKEPLMGTIILSQETEE